jgi:hypothetical protein
MSVKRMSVIAGVAVLMLLGVAAFETSLAQNAQGGPHAPRLHNPCPYIVITPRPLLYRRCVDWLETQYRPSGTVLYPQFRCWWVRG